MKTPTDNIFQLIHAMTAAEKRYFKRHYSTKESHATLLFDFINKQKAYDEFKVKEQFTNTNLSKNLKVHKAQLSKLLIKSLCSYHNKKSLPSKIRMGLEEIELLMKMQLFDMAHNRLANLKKLCTRYHFFDYIYPILILDLHFHFFYTADNAETKNLSIFNEFLGYSKAIKTMFQLSDADNILTKAALSNAQLKEEDLQFYEQFLNQPIEGKADSIEQIYKLQFRAQLLVCLQKDHLKSFDLLKKCIDFFARKKDFIITHPIVFGNLIITSYSVVM